MASSSAGGSPGPSPQARSQVSAAPVLDDSLSEILRSATLHVVILCVVTLLAYSNSFKGVFVFDDLVTLVNTNWLTAFDPPPLFWDATAQAPVRIDSRPFGQFSFWLTYQIFGGEEFGFHVMNLLIHGFAGLFLYDLVRLATRSWQTLEAERSLPKPGEASSSFHQTATPRRVNPEWFAFWVALFWMVHPLQTQGVTYVVQRFESQMAMFFLFALWCVFRGARSVELWIAWYAAAVIGMILSLGTKQVAMTFIPVLAVLDRALLSHSWREVARSRWGLYVLLVFPTLWGGSEILGLVRQSLKSDAAELRESHEIPIRAAQCTGTESGPADDLRADFSHSEGVDPLTSACRTVEEGNASGTESATPSSGSPSSASNSPMRPASPAVDEATKPGTAGPSTETDAERRARILAVLPPPPDAGHTTELSVGFAIKDKGAWAYLRSQPAVILHYLRLVVVPYPLCLDYTWPVSRKVSEYALPFAIVTALVLASLIGFCTKYRVVGALGLVFFFILAPSSSLIPIKDLAVEHRMYLPLAPLLALLVLAARRPLAWLARLIAADEVIASSIVGGLVAALFVMLTLLRNEDYSSKAALWQSAIYAAPKNLRAYTHLGLALAESARYREADVVFRKGRAVADELLADDRIVPLDKAMLLNNMGTSLHHDQKLEEASRVFLEALFLDPKYSSPWVNLGAVWMTQKKEADAIPVLEIAIRLNPSSEPAMINLARSNYRTGNLQASLAWYEKVLASPGQKRNPKEWYDYSGVLYEAKRFQESEVAIKTAVQCLPPFPNVMRDLRFSVFNHWGVVCLKLEKWGEAIQALNQAITIEQGNADVFMQRAGAFEKLGQLVPALQDCERALQLLDPDSAIAATVRGSRDQLRRRVNERP